ncbi:MAG: DUF1569 domain-containing protein [Gilvibacter sp.]
MQSLLNEEGYHQIKNRLNAIKPENDRLWGKMEAPQMFKHCQYPLITGLNTEPVKPKVGLMAMIFKKSMYSDKLWRKNMPTPKKLQIRDDRNFDSEKQKLSDLIDAFHARKTDEHWEPHPMFGTFTKEQWGQMQYKHLDHHFRQFGV